MTTEALAKRALAVLLVAACTLAACAKVTRRQEGPEANGQTHWLQRCQADDDCGSALRCECDVCIAPCESDDDCSERISDTTCRPAASRPARRVCGEREPHAMCLAGCGKDADCPATQECVASACVPKSDQAAPFDAGVFDSGADASPPPSQDAAVVVLDAEAAVSQPVTAPYQCKQPLPAKLPSLPAIRNVDGRPSFDLWRDLKCDALPAEGALCSEAPPLVQCGMCIGELESDDGVCASVDSDVWCDGEGEAFSVSPGCYICAPIAAHARACCEGLDVDCRAWPFPGDSQRGMLCARHEDCAEGLLCGAPIDGSGYGLCHCPEEAGSPRDLVFCDERIRRP